MHWLTVCRYFKEKHWLANNVLGLAFSVQGIEHLSLGAVSTGVILLSGLFFYDIFWVFCTPVMVSVVSTCAVTTYNTYHMSSGMTVCIIHHTYVSHIHLNV